MNEDEAQGWVTVRHGSEACARIGLFLSMVIAENATQNLISPGTVDAIWSRHAVDSAQLLGWAPQRWDVWLDIGTGAGFPGMIVALLSPGRRVIMAEPRGRRAAFLEECRARLELPLAEVRQAKVQRIEVAADVISARAVAPPEKLLRDAAHCAKAETVWLLPRGRSGAAELEHDGSMFHVEQSITDPTSRILIARGVA